MKLACLIRRMLAKSSLRRSCRAARLSAAGFASVALASVSLIAAPLRAGSYSWATSTGDWSVASNWGGTLLPSSSSDTVYVVNGGTVNVTQLGETCGTLALGDSAGNGTVQMTGGGLAANYVYMGGNGPGAFLQSGGATSIASSLYLGYNAADTAELYAQRYG